MQTKTVTLTKEEEQKLSQIESSIQHWSIEHSKMVMKSQDILSTLRSIYAVRKQTFDGFCKKLELDPSLIMEIKLIPNDQNGTDMILTINDESKENTSNS